MYYYNILMASKSRSCKSSSKSSKCPKGKIRRKSYVRRSHMRQPYRSKSKSKSKRKSVMGSYVDRTRVKSRCIKDRGKPGKGPKTLPPIGKKGFLRRHGYSVKKTVAQRERSLKRASKEENPLAVLRHLNLIRNYTADKKSKRVMSRDVNFMSKHYKETK